MKNIYKYIIIKLFLLCFVSVPAQQSSTGNYSVERMRRDISFLASDSLNGREAGTDGERMASVYISKQMEEIGLLPEGNEAGSYLSAFRMSHPVIFRAGVLRINDVEFKYNEEFGATDLSSPGDISAQLINIGKGNQLIGIDRNSKSETEEINNKIVLMDIATVKGKMNNSEMLSDIIDRVKASVKIGAVGVILHNSSRKPTEDLLFGSPFTESLDVPVVYIARLPFNKISEIKTASCSLKVVVDRTVSKPANVIGKIDNKSSRTVVIGAHYDHVGMTRPRTGDDRSLQIHNGADDNASGTSAMLELARWAANNESLKYNYIFAAFSAEEKGLFGSKAFCSREWVNNENIVYMLNLDMVGRLGCKGDTLTALGMASSPVWDQVIDNLEHPDFLVEKIKGAPPFSDHAPFLKKNIPVMYFTTGLHPDYHMPADDSEFINYTGMAEIITYIRQFILAAEKLPEIPFQKVNVVQQIKAYVLTF